MVKLDKKEETIMVASSLCLVEARAELTVLQDVALVDEKQELLL